MSIANPVSPAGYLRKGMAALAASLALSTLILPTLAQAQQLPPDVGDEITRGSQIDDAVRTSADQSRGQISGDVIDGEGGVFILQRNKIFSVGGQIGAGYESNAARQMDSGSGTIFASANMFVGADTRLGGKIDAGISLSASAIEYDKDVTPGSRSLVLSANVGTGLFDDAIYASVSAYGGINANESFKNDSTFYGAALTVSTMVPVAADKALRPSVSVSRQMSQVSEQNNWSLTARVDGIWQIQPRLRAVVTGSYTHRMYDNFFEDVTLVERNDDKFEARAGLTYFLSPDTTLGVSASYTKQESSFFLSEFEAASGGATFDFVHRF